MLSQEKHLNNVLLFAAVALVPIPQGSYLPFFSVIPEKGKAAIREPVVLEAFEMDRYPVTKDEFRRFIDKHPEWSKSKVKRLFADRHYLENWVNTPGDSPVTDVSWFAARAYCETKGEELPTTDQWEYVAYDRGKGPKESLAWYGKPDLKRFPAVTTATRNGYGVHGLLGLVWEWTLDFNAENTDDSERAASCGGASIGASDASDAARFMRYSFRSSLRANYAVRNLGFRCVKENGL